ncbi:hypothetical protein PCLA_05f0082 [Pseudomonas citronellolis]|nr:hypothetical protein PCLA_05f0082 [Pseudomonas citronellolis]
MFAGCRKSRTESAPTLSHPRHSPVGARPARDSRAGPAPTRRLGARGRTVGATVLPAAPRRASTDGLSLGETHAVVVMGIASLNAILRVLCLPEGVGADLVRDSREFRRGSRMRSAPTLRHSRHSPVGARPARDSRAGPAPTRRLGARGRTVGATVLPAAPRRASTDGLSLGETHAVVVMGIASLNAILRVLCLPEGGADLVRDSREFRRGSRMRSAPTLRHCHSRHSHVGARPARDSRAGPAPTGRLGARGRTVGADSSAIRGKPERRGR